MGGGGIKRDECVCMALNNGLCWNKAGAADDACAVTAGGAAASVLGLLVLLGLPGADGVAGV